MRSTAHSTVITPLVLIFAVLPNPFFKLIRKIALRVKWFDFKIAQSVVRSGFRAKLIQQGGNVMAGWAEYVVICHFAENSIALIVLAAILTAARFKATKLVYAAHQIFG